jgi:hypothetical protein
VKEMKVMMAQLVLLHFLFLDYKAFNPPVRNSFLLRKRKFKYKAV